MAPTSNRSARERAEELLDYVTEMRDDEGSLAVVADALAGIGYAVLALADAAQAPIANAVLSLADTRAPEPAQALDCGVSWVGHDQ